MCWPVSSALGLLCLVLWEPGGLMHVPSPCLIMLYITSLEFILLVFNSSCILYMNLLSRIWFENIFPFHIDRFSLSFFSPHLATHSSTQGSFLEGSKDHMRSWGSNLGQPCPRKTPSLLYYCSGPGCFFFIDDFFFFLAVAKAFEI